MLEEIQALREEIYKNFIDKNYESTFKLSKKYLKEIQKIRREIVWDTKAKLDINESLWFANYYVSYMYKKLGNIKEATRYAKVSIKYAIKMTNNYNNKMLKENSCLNKSRWLLACLYDLSNRPYKAIQNYKRCARFYKYIEQNRYRSSVLFNVAKILNKPQHMLKIIDILENEENGIYDGELSNTDKHDILQEAYTELVELYLKNNQMQNVFKVLHRIKCVDIKKNLIKLINENNTIIA